MGGDFQQYRANVYCKRPECPHASTFGNYSVRTYISIHFIYKYPPFIGNGLIKDITKHPTIIIVRTDLSISVSITSCNKTVMSNSVYTVIIDSIAIVSLFLPFF